MKKLNDLKNVIGEEALIEFIKESVPKQVENIAELRDKVIVDGQKIMFNYQVTEEHKPISLENGKEFSKIVAVILEESLRKKACEVFAPGLPEEEVNSAMINIMVITSTEVKSRSGVVGITVYI